MRPTIFAVAVLLLLSAVLSQSGNVTEPEGTTLPLRTSCSADKGFSFAPSSGSTSGLAFSVKATAFTFGSTSVSVGDMVAFVSRPSGGCRIDYTATAGSSGAGAQCFVEFIPSTASQTIVTNGQTITSPANGVRLNMGCSALPSSTPVGTDADIKLRFSPPSDELAAGSFSTGFFENGNMYVYFTDQGVAMTLQLPRTWSGARTLTASITEEPAPRGASARAGEPTAVTTFNFADAISQSSFGASGSTSLDNGPADDTGAVVNSVSDDDDDSSDAPLGAIAASLGICLFPIILLVGCMLLLVVLVVVVLFVLVIVVGVALVVILVMAVLKLGPFSDGGGPVSKNAQIWWDETDYEDEDDEDDEDDYEDDEESDEESSDF